MGCTSSVSTAHNHQKKNMDETSTERVNRIRRECRQRIKERIAEGGNTEQIEKEENERAKAEIAKPIWEAQPIAAHRKSNKFSTLKHHHTTRHDKHHHDKYKPEHDHYDEPAYESPPVHEEQQQHEQQQQPQPIEEEEGPPLLTPDGLVVLDEIELWTHEEQEVAAIEDMRISVFTSHLPMEVVDAIGSKLVLTRYAPSHVIYYTDQEADMFYIIRAGAVCIQVEHTHPDDKERHPPAVDDHGHIILDDRELNTLAIKQRGDLFGIETMSSTPHPRRTIASAYTDCLCWTLHRSDIDSLMEQFPESRDIIVTCLSQQIEACLSRCSYLEGVAPREISILAALVQYKHVEENMTLFEEGDPPEVTGNCLYVIFHGQVDVLVKDDGTSRPVKTLSSSSMFGEVGLIMDLPRTATVVSKTACLLLELAQTSFRNFVMLAPSILTRFKDQVELYHINAHYLLDNSIIVDFFVQFCEKEFSSENVEFWLEAVRFRRTNFPGTFELTQAAQTIYDTYIDRSATKQVNLKGQILNYISDSVHTRTNMNSNLFVDAEKEILLLMTSDSFFRFKSSTLFARCLEHINAPYVLPPRPRPVEDENTATCPIVRPSTTHPSQHRVSVTAETSLHHRHTLHNQSSQRHLHSHVNNNHDEEKYVEESQQKEIEHSSEKKHEISTPIAATIFLPTDSSPVVSPTRTVAASPEPLAANGLPSEKDLMVAAAESAPADANGIIF